MELVAYFDSFLLNEVNLNQGRIDILNEKVRNIDEFFKNNKEFKKYYKTLIPQGSYGQKTIIKPPKEGQEFDVDVLLSLQKVEGWEPKEYVEKLYQEFYSNGNYKRIIGLNTRCVTLNYVGDFHVDIVPFLQVGSKFFITNREENKLEQTNPVAYTEWLMTKNKNAFNQLIHTIRLFKYLRDVKQNFTIKSILLNTLLGNCINASETPTDFRNLPTTFLTIITRLNNFLQANPNMPTIVNPTLPQEEDFNRHWDQKKYSNFRDKINFYAQKTKEAYDEGNKDESIKKWKIIFSDQFPSSVVEDGKTAAFSILSLKSKPWSY